MGLELFSLSGSPFAWRVWLALQHKRLPHVVHRLSSDSGDLGSDAFRSLNPHGKVPVLVHDDFVLYESSAIVEYLDDAFPYSGPALWPADLRLRARGRRLAAEVDNFLYPPTRRLVEQITMRRDGEPDPEVVAPARAEVGQELTRLADEALGGFLLGDEPSAADFALYPLTAILLRLHTMRADLGLASLLPQTLRPWQRRIEALPGFAETWPHHWPARDASTNGFLENQP